MRYSKLFGKTIKSVPRDITIKSHKLLYQAGYIRESRAGRYYFLPLGMKVHDKIARVAEEEMDRSGAQKMVAPTLHPIELWQETNRDSSGGYELMTVDDRRGAKFALGGTGEEMFVDVVRGFKLSYRELPINIYQFGLKFRDEMRASGGLLRTREFVMKDGYSFHTSDEDFKKEYQNMWDTYLRIFKRIGLGDVNVVPADNGYFGGEYCHEFIVESAVGESHFLLSEDGKYVAHEDVAKFKREEMNPEEEMKAMQIVEQPEWVKTMDDNLKHYGEPLWRFLKNVVYKDRQSGEIIIATIRGDLEVNKNKLEHTLDRVGMLDEATEADLASIGTKPGWVHSWGHDGVKYVGDTSLWSVRNFIGGQKEAAHDSINVNYGRDFEHEVTADIALAKAGHKTEDGSSLLIEKLGIEVGNIFQLGQHYSLKMAGSVFVDSDGIEKPFYMGCYGIGIARSMATVVERYADDAGIVWPISIAPYQVHLVSLIGQGGDEVECESLKLYNSLTAAGIEVLWDDRVDVSPGAKFADSDLLGMPIRVLVSRRSLDGGGVELKLRESDQIEILALDSGIEIEIAKKISVLQSKYAV